MTNELKPCPFCGGEAEAEHYESDDFYGGYLIFCTKCGAQITPCNASGYDARKIAIESWNTRQPAFDWKPIEELFKEDLNNWELVLLAGEIKNSLMEVGEQDNGDVSLMFDNEFVCDYEDLEWVLSQGRYTRYALLTPLQTNQS